MAIRWQNNSDISYEQWLVYKNNTIGASESSVIIFGSKWSSNLEIWYQKVGMPRSVIENIRMFLGKETEDLSARLWAHYDGENQQSVVDNVRKGTPLKKCINLNSTVFNDKYLHLSATPDRQIQPWGKYAGMGTGSLEIKNTQSWVLTSQKDGGLPPENVVQLSQQLMLTEDAYGELFYFIDNMRCDVHPMKRSEMANLEETILLWTDPFWSSVLKARPVYNQMYEAQRTMNMRLVAECQKELISLEPPVQNSDGYRNFLSERFKDKTAGVGIVPGKPDQLIAAREWKSLDKQIKELSEKQRAYEIQLKMAIGDNSALDFGKDGKVSWNENKNGSRVFNNKVKVI